MRKILLFVTHLVVGLIGFAAGIYTLPILTAPESPSVEKISQMTINSVYKSNFVKELKDSDFLHQAEGEVSVSPKHITFQGSMSPGPDYILYLSPEFIDTEAEFNKNKVNMTAVGAVKTFDQFIVDVPASVNIENYNTVIIWCESFGEFISATQYK